MAYWHPLDTPMSWTTRLVRKVLLSTCAGKNNVVLQHVNRQR